MFLIELEGVEWVRGGWVGGCRCHASYKLEWKQQVYACLQAN